MKMSEPKKAKLPPEIKLIPYVLVGFSCSQILGILITAYGVYQAYIVIFFLIVILLIPSALTVAGVQSKVNEKLPKFRIASFYMPSMMAIFILVLGVAIGFWIGSS